MALFNGNWLVFAFNVPLCLYHIHKFIQKDYKVYAITRSEYKKKHQEIVKMLKYKMAYYLLMLVLVAVILVVNSANLVAYRLFGNVLINNVFKK